MSTRELAAAHGFGDVYPALQELRKSLGDPQPVHLLKLPEAFRRGVLGIARDDDPQQLENGLRALIDLVDAAPTRESELLRLAFNFDQEYGDRVWMRRVGDYAIAHGGDEKTIRGQVDIAILQLLLRTREAAEKVPEPDGPYPGRAASTPASDFFDQDYVRNSHLFVEAWEDAESVDMCGFGHNRMLVSYSSEILAVLRRGGAIRTLLQDPEGRAVIDANYRSSTPKASEESIRHQHRAGLAALASLKHSAEGRGTLSVRTYDIMPPFTGYFFNASSMPGGIAFIWFWSWRQASSWRPGFAVRRECDTHWFDRFYSQFEALWRDLDATTPLEI